MLLTMLKHTSTHTDTLRRPYEGQGHISTSDPAALTPSRAPLTEPATSSFSMKQVARARGAWEGAGRGSRRRGGGELSVTLHLSWTRLPV